ITAVLGPNGCGKTNIVDAIRWVLGEQKTRLLRNTKMENVIFNGTKRRKPLGMAEVHMTLSNEDGTLPIDYSEITISRKLYRSGNSEYSINGELARLKDIRSLLVDTGLGNHTYSIIEREMVDSVISDKEQDKRYLLEEAAGVMRYRIQREEALRKIGHTETDLARLGDILAELERELRSLRYQMGKARRYTRLKEKVEVMEAALIKRSLFDLLNEIDAVKKEKAHHESITLADDNEITVRENKLQESRITNSEVERRLQDLYEHRHGLSRELQRHEERIAILNERIASNENRIVENEEEIKRANLKMSSLSQELAQFSKIIEGKEVELGRQRIVLGNTEDSLRTITRELEDIKNQIRDKKQLALDLVRERERVRGIREHLKDRLTELRSKRDTQDGEIDRLKREEEALVTGLLDVANRSGSCSARVTRVNQRIDELTAKEERAAALMTACENNNLTAVIELNRAKEKKEYLEQIKGEHSRYAQEAMGRNSRIKGVLADRVRVDRKYRKCIEACLSPVLQSLLTDSREDAFQCLDDIRTSGAGNGKVQFLYPNSNGGSPATPEGGGSFKRALDVLSAEDGVAGYLDSYLTDVFLVESLDEAMGMIEADPDVRVATVDGVFFDGPGRIVVAGSDDVEMTMLEFESKVEELNASIARFEERVKGLERRKGSLGDLRSQLSGEIAQLRNELDTAQRDRTAAQDDQRRIELDLVKLREQIAGLNKARADYRATIEELQAKLQSNPEPEDDSREAALTDDELTAIEKKAVDREREKESLAETAAKIRLEIATISGEVGAATEKQKNVEMLDAELKELIVYRREDAKRCRFEIESSQMEISESRNEIASSHKELETIESDIETAKETHELTSRRCGELETELKELKDQRDHKRENIQRCNLEIATRETRIGDLVDKARENFNQDLRPLLSNRDGFEPAEWEELDFDALEELRTKVESFGPVNMLALDEFTEKKERFDFLSSQKADLEEAKNDLTQAIRRINREARRRLNETFERVRGNFKATFLTLFDGGEADLLFVDSDDPLEANIKIVANPKGKRLHDISSLSGGERALVALSLLFAIYLVKPSPFCVFDEVDAPLDDANIARFVKLLKSFTDKTQFVVITHNKKTMEAADYLYGVTMEEPGVSKMISVHIGEVDRFRDENGAVRESPTEEEVTVQT
ncbi:MAG: chromosome segregation protein SMC, partial [Candidatus Latescibacterota bacterium]